MDDSSTLLFGIPHPALIAQSKARDDMSDKGVKYINDNLVALIVRKTKVHLIKYLLKSSILK